VHGHWDEALEEAMLACDRLAGPRPHPAIGMAYYEAGELHRLRGAFEAAELTTGRRTGAAAPLSLGWVCSSCFGLVACQACDRSG
jgi:hypothetical protein